MVTEQHKKEKQCCLYASDYHLEMILLPYIKNNIDISQFIIITQNDLQESIKVLLDRVNIKEIYKKRIFALDWKKTDTKKIIDLKNWENKDEIFNIIINGDYDYIKDINNKLDLLNIKNIKIIECVSIYDKNVDKIKNNYTQFLNTTKI